MNRGRGIFVNLAASWRAGKRRRVVCRCHRAWLPPSFTWLFPPRSPLHACGGYYFERAGHEDEQHPLCAASSTARMAA